MPLLRVLIAGRDVLGKLAGTGEVSRSIRTIGGGGWLPDDRVAFPNLAVVAGRWLTYHETAELAATQRAAAALGLDALVHHCTLHVPQHIVEVIGSRGNGPPETRCAVVGTTSGGLEQPGWYVQTWRDRDDALVGWRRSGWFETETARLILEPLAAVGIRRIALAIPLAQDTGHAREIARMRQAIEAHGIATERGAPIDILAPATVPG